MEERVLEIETAYECGVICLHGRSCDPDAIGEKLHAHYRSSKFGYGLVLFSSSVWASDYILALMHDNAPEMQFAACSTSGELTPSGMAEGDLLILLFPNGIFEFEAFELGSGHEHDIQGMVQQITTYKNRFYNNRPNEEIWPAAICLIDGLSNHEEAIAAALHWALEDIPLLGGSAGDNMAFQKTSLLLNGEAIENSAIIILIKSKVVLEVFKTENFVPTEKKLVVTKSEPERRTVLELNGCPAAKTYSETIHRDPVDLAPQSFASHPLVVKVGGEYYCRSIQKVNNDGSMTFFCAIDDGIVLTVAEPRGMVESTRRKLSEVSEKIGGIDFILGFDCVLRKIDAGNRQVIHSISDVYRDHNLVGFNTYGEQYRSMHLNQTLTGLAFGPLTKG